MADGNSLVEKALHHFALGGTLGQHIHNCKSKATQDECRLGAKQHYSLGRRYAVLAAELALEDLEALEGGADEEALDDDEAAAGEAEAAKEAGDAGDEGDEDDVAAPRRAPGVTRRRGAAPRRG